jgi:hypothetical protein
LESLGFIWFLLGLAWFYLVLFVRIGPFQWVTSNPNKKLFGAFGVPIAGTGYGLSDIQSHNSDFCEGNSPSAAIVSKIPARLGKGRGRSGWVAGKALRL